MDRNLLIMCAVPGRVIFCSSSMSLAPRIFPKFWSIRSLISPSTPPTTGTVSVLIIIFTIIIFFVRSPSSERLKQARSCSTYLLSVVFTFSSTLFGIVSCIFISNLNDFIVHLSNEYAVQAISLLMFFFSPSFAQLLDFLHQ